MIPVSANIHNHILGHQSNEVPINTDPRKSEGDNDAARLWQKKPETVFSLYVIEAKENGKYLNALYEKASDDYLIINDNITFNEICDGIY